MPLYIATIAIQVITAVHLLRAGRDMRWLWRFADAIRVCGEARTGIFEEDPKILLPLANARFGAGQYQDAIAMLDYLHQKNPGFPAVGSGARTESLVFW